MSPELMSGYLIKISIRILFLGIVLFDYGFGTIFHGIGMQMTNNGAGVYYKPGIPLNINFQFIGDFGLHFDNGIQSSSMYGVNKNNRSVLLNISAGFRKELLREMIVGLFRPVIIIQGGVAADMYSFSLRDIISDWIIINATGVGFQFYNGRKLNEILMKINLYNFTEWSLAGQFSIYWK